MKKEPQVIAIDFDGTCVSHEFPAVGKDIGAIHILKKLVEAGHKLILYTMRSDGYPEVAVNPKYPEIKQGAYLNDAVNWFIENGIPLFAIQSNPDQEAWTSSPKCYADLYIDDNALGIPLEFDENISRKPFVDWKMVDVLLFQQGFYEGWPSWCGENGCIDYAGSGKLL